MIHLPENQIKTVLFPFGNKRKQNGWEEPFSFPFGNETSLLGRGCGRGNKKKTAGNSTPTSIV